MKLNIYKKYPLSNVQMEIFLEQEKYHGQPVFNVGGYIRLPAIHVASLQQAHKALVESNDVFSIRIELTEDGVYQYCASEVTTELPVIDLSKENLPSDEAEQWLSSLFESSFSLIDSELFKSFLLKVSDEHWLYVGLAHHIIMDGWGFANWAKQLCSRYNGSFDDESIFSFLESTLNKQKYSTSKNFVEDKSYWTNELKDFPAPFLKIQAKAHYLPNAQVKSRREVYTISHYRHEQLCNTSKNIGIPVAQLYQAIFNVYLHKVYGINDFTVGSTIHNRTSYKEKNLLGAFVSVIPNRVKIFEKMTFEEMCLELSTKSRSNYRHQKFPSSEMKNILLAQKSDYPLYEVVFNYLKLDSDILINGQEGTLAYQSHNHERTPLIFTIWEYGQGQDLEIKIDYNLNFFCHDELLLLVSRIDCLISQVIEDTALQLDTLCLLPEREQKLISDFSKGEELPYSLNYSAVHLFEQNVQRAPHSAALTCGEINYTYQYINHKSNLLANYLLRTGYTSGQCIGINCSRSVNMVLAVLAVSKIGGIFISLDPSYPTSRLEYIAVDSNIELILSESFCTIELAEIPTLFLDHLDKFTLGDVFTNPEVAFSPEQIAYMIYTSGSTGKPKGVKIRHRNLLAMLYWAKASYSDAQLRSVLASTSLNFDLSIFELFVPLCFGHKCVLVENALALIDTNYDVTLLNTVPSALKALLEVTSIPASINTVNLAGEPLSAAIVNQLLSKSHLIEVNNLYGPSEDTTYSTRATFTAPLDGVPTIGRVIANSQAWVLDESMQLCPIGRIGELYLAGDGVAAGYNNQAILTAEKFLDSKFSKGKLYRTGDLVRYRIDGHLEYLGRIDDQVKFKGYRIELEEVTHALLSCAGICDACVIVAYDSLLAFLVGEDINVIEIKGHLQNILPSYMVPTQLIILDEMPLNANGKIDKQALRNRQLVYPSNGCDIAHAKTPTEKELVSIVSEVLERDSIELDINTSFLSLGGHSLLTVKLVANIRAKFGVYLQVRDVFNATSLTQLAAIIDNESYSSTVSKPIERMERSLRVPLSANQNRIWMAQQLAGGTSLGYNMPYVAEVSGVVDCLAIEKALSDIIDRHEVLSTVYLQDEHGVHAVTLNNLNFKLDIVDIPQYVISVQEIQNHIDDFLEVEFNLEKDIPIRARWIRLNENCDNNILVLNIHHIAFDGWSINVLLKELEAFYALHTQVITEINLQPAVQYRDFTFWQLKKHEEGQLNDQKKYWINQLSDIPTRHTLPIKNLVNNKSIESITVLRNKIDLFLLEKLQIVCTREGLTPFMFLHAVLTLVLARYSNSKDIVVGTPNANRGYEELHNAIGFFVNILVLRTSLEPQSVKEFFKHIRDVNLMALANSEIDFENVLQACHVDRTLESTPLFQILFTVNSFNADSWKLGDAHVTARRDLPRAKKFELEIEVNINDGDAEVVWIFDDSIFAHTIIASMASSFGHTITELCESNIEDIADIDVIVPAEKNMLLREFNQNTLHYPKDSFVIGLFESQVASRGQQIALSCAERSFSYAELNQLANGLAWKLSELGVNNNSKVAVSCQRDITLVVSILATFKLGATYVPIDINYPQNRKTYIIRDSKATVLLTSQKTDKLGEVENCVLLDETELFAQRNEQNLHTNIQAQDVTHIIYTSGSTGLPKGVEITNQNVVAMLFWANSVYSPDEARNVLASTSISFDLSIFELFFPLCFGYQCTLVDNALALLENMPEVSLINTVPSAIKLLLDADAVPNVVKVVNLAGEQLASEIINALLTRGIPAVCNLYGPSEDTTYSTYARYTQEVQGVPSIGKPIHNSQAYILSDELAILPFGTPGELYLGGDGVANGYVDQKTLTEQKFIINPFGKGRLYRTGDIVKYTDLEGNMTFLGRADDQVKVRGFRIELSEIEVAIKDAPNVHSCSVVVSGQNENRYLTAYIVPVQPLNTEESQFKLSVQQAVKQFLPEHMLPSELILLESLPLTPNGKVDKSALTKLAIDSKAEKDTLLPSSEVEERIQKIWQSLLVDVSNPIGCDENFFEHGGHSIIAVKLLLSLEKEFGYRLSVKDIFTNPTIAQQADLITNNISRERVTAIPRVDRAARWLPLSFSQKRIWFLQQLETSRNEFDMYASWEVSGQFDVKVANKAFKQIIKRHEVLRSQFYEEDGKPYVTILDRVSFNLKYNDLSCLDRKECETQLTVICNTFQQAPLRYDSGCLLDARFINLPLQDGSGYGRLLFKMHHIISDGWSLGVLIKEFAVHYKALVEGTEPEVEDLPVQYVDFANWQLSLLSKSELESKLEYWKKLLADAPSSHKLPLDNQRGSKENKGEVFRQQLPRSLCKEILMYVNRLQTTPFVFMETALALHVGRLSHEYDVIIGTPVSGRNHYQVQPLIGLFLNTKIIRNEFSDNPQWHELLLRTHGQFTESSNYEDVPFEAIVERLNAERNLQQSPIFQILINYDNTEKGCLDIQGCELTPNEHLEQTSKYDITLYIKGKFDESIELTWVYNSGIFNAEKVAFYAREFVYLLGQVLSKPTEKVLNYSWSEKLSLQLSAGRSNFDFDIFAKIEKQAMALPDALALTYRDQVYTYQQLIDITHQLSNYLMEKGIEPSERVAVYTRRSHLRVFAILSIMNLGGCYVPLSEELPHERLAYMLEDSQAQTLVVDKEGLNYLSSGLINISGLKIVLLSEHTLERDLEKYSRKCLVRRHIGEKSVAHIIYTSGSTGLPKGVLGNYRATANRINWMLEKYPYEGGERTIHITSMAFIRAIWELFVPLSGGAHLILCDRNIVKDTARLMEFICEYEVSRIVTAPSQLNAVVAHTNVQKAFGLKYWFVSGEPLLQANANQALIAIPGLRLINLYGSTEVMSDVLYKNVEIDEQVSLVPIGSVIDNTGVHILTAANQPVPKNVIGEIAISGAGLSNGYINNHEKNKEVFVQVSNTFLYKTGDLGYINNQNEVICLGRADEQIKVRGYRIEPGEVVSVVNACDSVKDSYLRPVKKQEHTFLCLYIVPVSESSEHEKIIREVKEACSKSLPSYMHPATINIIEKLPLRPNGKVQKASLPEPVFTLQSGQIISPANKTEAEVRAIWSELLEIPESQISTDVGFFELGGHSLLATQLKKRLEESYRFNLSYQDFFKLNTISYLAGQVDRTKTMHDVLMLKSKNGSNRIKL